jgi:hypothetical protein
VIFEWDPAKEVRNRRKHGVSFVEASTRVWRYVGCVDPRQRVLDGQSTRSAKKLRPIAAKHAKDRFSAEVSDVRDMAVPKAGAQFPAGDPRILGAAAEQIAGELFAVVLLPPSPPEKSWLVRQFQDQTSAVIRLLIAALFGALIARSADIWRFVQSLVRP